MSTNKTDHFELHSWLPEDNFQLSEINENFKKLDAGARILTGQYSGPCRVELGVKPLAVIIICARGVEDYHTHDAIATQDYPVGTALVLDESGFTTSTDASIWVRMDSTQPHNYVVFY